MIINNIVKKPSLKPKRAGKIMPSRNMLTKNKPKIKNLLIPLEVLQTVHRPETVASLQNFILTNYTLFPLGLTSNGTHYFIFTTNTLPN